MSLFSSNIGMEVGNLADNLALIQNPHFLKLIQKATLSLWIRRKIFGKSLGLSQRIILWVVSGYYVQSLPTERRHVDRRYNKLETQQNLLELSL